MANEIVNNEDGVQEDPKKDEGFDFDSLDQNQTQNLDWVHKEKEVELESESAETSKDEEEEDSKDVNAENITPEEKYRRDAQSSQDKFYALQDKYAALLDRQDTRLSREPASEAELEENKTIEEHIKDQWGEDPALLGMAEELKSLKSQMGSSTAVEAQGTYTLIDSFCATNDEALQDKKVMDKFLDEMDDRVPGGNFGKILKDLESGKVISDDLKKSMEGKLKRALAAATAGLASGKRKKASAQRAEARSSVPKGVLPQAAQSVAKAGTPASGKPLTYRETQLAVQRL